MSLSIVEILELQPPFVMFPEEPIYGDRTLVVGCDGSRLQTQGCDGSRLETEGE